MIAGSSHSESAAAGQRGHKQEELGLLPARASSNSAKTPEDHFGHVRGTSLKDMTAYLQEMKPTIRVEQYL